MEPTHSVKPAHNHSAQPPSVESSTHPHTDQIDPAAYDALARLVQQHQEYDRRLKELLAMPQLHPDQQIEAVRLKKLKLRQKDAIEQLRYELHLYTGQQIEH